MMKAAPLLSWDIFSDFYFRTLELGEKNIEIDMLNIFAKKYDWKNDISKIIQNNDYEAIILTDHNQKIVWVNKGFSSMTGYSKNFAINKTPRFLQGTDTSIETKSRIRKKIKLNQPFREIIINHKKDQTPYKCEVIIIPLYNKETTHFLALEKQVI